MSNLEQAILRYGGASRWESLQTISIRLQHLGGLLPIAKGLGRTFSMPSVVRIHPKLFRVEFLDFPQAGQKLVFDQGRVAVFPSSETQFRFDSANYRKTFNGLAKNRRWSPIDAGYFFGYALSTYLSIPFLLPSLRTVTRPWKDEGFRIRAEFPPSIHTHGPHQEFFFDREGLLVRHDYKAEVVGWWATGAHFTSDFTEVAGLPIARARDVYARLGDLVSPIPVLSARFEPLEVL